MYLNCSSIQSHVQGVAQILHRVCDGREIRQVDDLDIVHKSLQNATLNDRLMNRVARRPNCRRTLVKVRLLKADPTARPALRLLELSVASLLRATYLPSLIRSYPFCPVHFLLRSLVD